MGDARYTPGPWNLCGETRGGCECGYVFGADGKAYLAKALSLADGVDPVADHETRRTNARLIAAAPGLEPTHG